MNITIDTDTPPAADELLHLFGQVDWAKDRSLADIQQCIDGMDVFAVARKDGTLVGFGRAVSDGVFRALIEDVIVDTTCRRQGIGRMIMKSLTKQLSSVEEVFLNTGKHLDAFYASFGFIEFDGHTMKSGNTT